MNPQPQPIPINLSPLDYQNLIIAELNDPVGGPIHTNILTLWALYANRGSVYLQYLYAKLKAIDLLLGPASRLGRTTQGRITIDDTTYFTNLTKMAERVQQEIQAELTGVRVGSTGMITQTAPIMPPVPNLGPGYVIDANDSRYQGNPYLPNISREDSVTR